MYIKLVVIFILFVLPTLANSEIIFQDNFETGDKSKWDYSVPLAEVTGSVVKSGAYSLHIPYDLPAGPPEHADNNRFVEVYLGEFSVDHFFVRGYFRLADTGLTTAAKKLYYIWSYPQSEPYWDIIVSAYEWGEDDLSITLSSNYYEYSDLRIPVWDIARGNVHYNTWHCLELEIDLNTPGYSDGNSRIWLDGALVHTSANISIRNDTKPLGIVRAGAQIDRNGDELARHEDRYWDNIVISTEYVGPHYGVTTGTSLGNGSGNNKFSSSGQAKFQ